MPRQLAVRLFFFAAHGSPKLFRPSLDGVALQILGRSLGKFQPAEPKAEALGQNRQAEKTGDEGEHRIDGGGRERSRQQRGAPERGEDGPRPGSSGGGEPRRPAHLGAAFSEGQRLRHAFRKLAEWEASEAFKASGCVPLIPCDLARDDAASVAIERGLVSYGHMTGTCPMGSVLDADCRVLGLYGLRVVDASVMPTIPSGNTYLGCVMIAERVARKMLAETRS